MQTLSIQLRHRYTDPDEDEIKFRYQILSAQNIATSIRYDCKC